MPMTSPTGQNKWAPLPPSPLAGAPRKGRGEGWRTNKGRADFAGTSGSAARVIADSTGRTTPLTLALSRKGRGDKRHSRSAFSLLELILVLAVLAVSAAMAVPSLSRFSRGRQALDAAAHMLAVIQYAQNQAVVTASPYRFQLDPAAGTYWLATRRDGKFGRLGSEFGRDFTLPQTLTAAWDASSDVTTNGYIEFAPDGAHEVASINLTAGDGELTVIGCDSPSEPFRITVGREGGTQ